MAEAGDILDALIGELQTRIAALPREDTATWIKLNDRLLKALGMKERQKRSRKGRGFDLPSK